MSYSVRYFTFRMDGFLSTVLCCNFLSTEYSIFTILIFTILHNCIHQCFFPFFWFFFF